MENSQNKKVYESYSDKELIKMWEEDINGMDMNSSNRQLMKAIDDNEEKKESGNVIPLYSKRMWDSATSKWVPFDIWGAHEIINYRKEYIQVQHYTPLPNQPEFGDTLKGWQSVDRLYLNDLNEILKEKTSSIDKFNQNASVARRHPFYEMIKQDQQEKRNESDYSDVLSFSRNNRRL